ncbi:FAD-binding oxidoreductase, partial [Psychrobacter sp. 1U2]|uniref:FAD-binding oxidoreductase n=1 Tax=Psychrobacter sp. 1U2 TaxID=3453577 RepID=UPI003F46B5BE
MTPFAPQTTTVTDTNKLEIIFDTLVNEHNFDNTQIKTDSESLEHWGKDWTKHFAPAPTAIVFPKTTEQVQAIVLLANGEIVVSMDKMNHIGQFYPADRLVEIEAGVITQQLQQFAESKDLYYPVDFASAGSSQMGGNIGTNAGGIKVIRYGMTRQWIMGLTVVTGKGDILQLNRGMVKNATGYDLRQLFIGSEGTLGLVTHAQIKLERLPQELNVMVLGMDSFNDVMNVLSAFQA